MKTDKISFLSEAFKKSQKSVQATKHQQQHQCQLFSTILLDFDLFKDKRQPNVMSLVFQQVSINSFIISITNAYNLQNLYNFQSIVSHVSRQMNNTLTHSKNNKRERTGRWSAAQANLFQELIQRYGKNWKKIHQHMRGRTLSQIRSHAQKFFDKVGHKKMQQYERRAKLLEALETLEKEKRLQEQSKAEDSFSQKSQEIALKKEEDVDLVHINEDQTITAHNLVIKENRSLESVKQQQVMIQSKKAETDNINNSSFYQMPILTNQHGYLMHLIYVNPNAFADYGLAIEQPQNHTNMQESAMPQARL